MATDVEKLVVSLEASIRGFERAMNKANGLADQSARKIERRFDGMSKRIETSYLSLNRGIASAFAGAAALRGAQQLIDASTRIENSLKVAGLSGEDLSNVYDKLFASAQRNAAPVESLVTLFGRASIVQKELGVTTQELLGFTDNVAVALRVAGTDAQTASGALLQLSQALGAGTVRAEEFNSIQEGALPVLQAVAAGLEEAGGSVAKLRGLVIDGKLSSEAFFRAFEAGSVVLRDKVASSELTISQGFIRLQNVLIDTAGKFDNATDGSSRLATGLDQLANYIVRIGNAAEENGPAIDRFLNFIGGAADTFSNSVFAGTERELQAIAGAVDAVAAGFDRYGASLSDAELATAQAEQALATFSLNASNGFGELEPVVQDFIQQLLEGRGTAESAAKAIQAIGDAGDFGPLIEQLGGLVDQLFAVRGEAAATAAAVAAAAAGQSSTTNIADQRAEQLGNRPKPVVKPVSIADYAPPVAAGGKGGGGSKKSGADRFGDKLADYQRRIDLMNRETELQRGLNPLVNDYGLAMERLRAQMELENAAKEAGLPLDDQRRQKIEELASGYAQATAEAAKLAEAQDKARQTADDLAAAGKRALDSIIDGFLEGRDAGEILNNTLQELGKSLLKIGLDGLLSGLGGGGGGVFGGLFGTLFGGKKETGGSVQAGKAYLVGEKRPELFVPGRSGTIIPKIPNIAGMSSQQGGSGGGQITVSADFQVVDGNLVPLITQVSGQVAGQQIKRNNKQLPSIMRDANQRYG